MIVDMIRNDMGHIAVPGSVRVPALYEIARYPTVWQMTSIVESRTRATFPEIMRALFPCASITGAPKVHTMEIIRDLEAGPRGIYTGCIGHVAPGGRAWFNVAIRTVVVDKATDAAAYGVGGGVVWDSDAEDEYRECQTKSAVLTARQPVFSLLETLLWEGAAGYFLLERHLARLLASARYFGIAVDGADVRRRLQRAGGTAGPQPARVRLTVSHEGIPGIEVGPLASQEPRQPWRVAFAPASIDKSDRFLYHKTTHRQVYDEARSSVHDVDDVLLWNTDGQVTESTIANIVIERGGRALTPPVPCGLLAGVFRDELLASGEIEEAVLGKADVRGAERLWMINSVRQWVPAVLLD